MYQKKRISIFSLSTLLVLVISAVFTVPALADGGTPTTTTTPTSGTSSNLSPGGTVVVLDGQGNKVPLGSQKAVGIISAGDPIWCPASVSTPVAGASGCSPSPYNGNLYTLTHAVQTGAWHPNLANSNIWIMGGADSSASQIYLNGSTLPNPTLSNFTLTFKGGWTGSGSGINPLNPSTFNGVGFSIGSWHNTVSVSNIIINNSPAGQDGLYIYSTKNIVVTNVSADNGQEYGAFLDNSTGTGVTITNSNFMTNDGALDSSYGLYVYSKGPIAVTDLTVSNNNFDGALLDNYTFSTTAQNLTLSGTNIFDSNGGFGMNAFSRGAITSGSLDANNNSTYGATLKNQLDATPLPITLNGTSSFSGNTGNGLNIYSKGNITVNNLSAVGNGNIGVVLQNNYNPFVASTLKVNGTNWFADNGWAGLNALSDGSISMNNITADGNGNSASYNGVVVENSNAANPEAVTLTGINTFNNNAYGGLLIQATGAVSLNNITAIGNGGYTGATVENEYLGASKPQTVTFLGTNNLSLNFSDNLAVETFGAITLNNMTANASLSGNGADLYYLSSATTGNVTINGINNFDFNSGFGLNIRSSGTVIANNINAIKNVGSSGVIIRNTASASAPVTLNGTNVISGNGVDGIDIFTNGNAVISNLTANSNGSGLSEYGAYIANNLATGTPTITLSGTNSFNYNYFDGLYAISKGAITASNLSAIGNVHGDGADLYNNGGSASITLSGNNVFDSNYGMGLILTSAGNISTSNLTAISNGNSISTYGVDLSNTSGHGTVTLSGTNTFEYNYSDGLDINSDGAITTNNMNASHNGYGGVNGWGAYITNGGAATGINVIMNGNNVFEYNLYDGLQVISNGTITTNNLTANNNGNLGAKLANTGAAVAEAITLKGTNEFLLNGSDGIDMYSKGAISLTHVTADLNYYDGVYANTNGNVTLTCGSLMSNGNATSLYGYGWETSSGVPLVTLIGVDTSGNYSGDYYHSLSTSTVFTPRTCTLP